MTSDSDNEVKKTIKKIVYFWRGENVDMGIKEKDYEGGLNWEEGRLKIEGGKEKVE
jgi:hypothetical protein